MDDKLNTKLTLEKATAIKTMLWQGRAQELIARQFGVTQTTVSRILHGKQWTSAPWPNDELGAMPLARLSKLKTGQLQLRSSELYPSDDRDRRLTEAPPEHRRDQIADVIQGLAAEAETEMEQELIATMVGVDSDQRLAESKSSSPGEADFMPWDEVVEKGGDLPIVIACLEDKDEILKKAIGVVFRALSPREWGLKKTEQFVKQVYQELKKES